MRGSCDRFVGFVSRGWSFRAVVSRGRFVGSFWRGRCAGFCVCQARVCRGMRSQDNGFFRHSIRSSGIRSFRAVRWGVPGKCQRLLTVRNGAGGGVHDGGEGGVRLQEVGDDLGALHLELVAADAENEGRNGVLVGADTF